MAKPGLARSALRAMLRRPMANWPFVQKVGSKWRGWYLVEGDRRYLPLRTTAKEASKEAQDYRDALRSGGALGGMTIGNLADRFLDDVHSTRSFGTWGFYSNQLAGVFRTISRDMLLALVGPGEMRRVITEHQKGKFSAQTIQHRRAVLRRMFRWAKKCGICNMAPTEEVDWPQPQAAAFDVLSSDEMREHLSVLQAVPADYDLVLVAIYTGLRRGELARLRVDEIDLAAGVVWVRGKMRREPVPIDPAIEPSLRAMIDRTGGPWLLPESAVNRGKKKVTRELSPEEWSEVRRAYTVANTFRRWAKKFADRRFHPHTLRHTLCTELLKATGDLEVSGRALRHKHVQTTKRYAHLAATDLRAATARLKLVPKIDGEAQHG